LLVFSSKIISEAKPTESDIENQLYRILNKILEIENYNKNTENYIRIEEPYPVFHKKYRKSETDQNELTYNNKRNAYRNFSKGLYSDMLRKLASAG